MKKISFISAVSIGLLSISLAAASPSDAVGQIRQNATQVLSILKGGDADGVLPECCTDAEEDSGGRTEGCARRDAEDVRIGERVLYNRLHDDTAGGKTRADDRSEQETRQPQQPYNVMHRSLTRRVDGCTALDLVEDGGGNDGGRQIDRPDRERPEKSGNEECSEQNTEQCEPRT